MEGGLAMEGGVTEGGLVAEGESGWQREIRSEGFEIGRKRMRVSGERGFFKKLKF